MNGVLNFVLFGIALYLFLSSISPFSHTFLPKSRQAEAKSNLYHIYTLQEAIHSEKFKYFEQEPVGNMGLGKKPICSVDSELGFKIDGCEEGRVRYTYFVTVSPDSSKFKAYAISYPGPYHVAGKGCKTADVWTIDQDRKIVNLTNAIDKCS